MTGKKKRGGSGREEMGFPCRVSTDGDSLRIVAELPGISEEKIRLDLDETTLIISVDDRNRQYRMPVTLPWAARLGAKKFRKGVLELTMERCRR